jgi:acetyltransferase
MELIAVAGIFSYLKDKPENLAIITHAGGSAVLLTDVLEKGGLKVPDLSQNPDSKILSSYLYEGSSVSNPIDFLATGTADQLGIIIDFCEHKFDEVDGIIVVFGSPGLFNVKNVYNVLDAKMRVSKKPIFPVLPSIINAKDEINYFLSKGHVNFTDEVELGRALCAIHKTPNVLENKNNHFDNPSVSTKNLVEVKKILSFQKKPILNPKVNDNILKLLGIETVNEKIVNNETSLLDAINELGFPLVMKVIGPVHKTEVNGVSLNISNKKSAVSEFERLMKIESSTGVLIQEMVIGSELYVGAKREDNYGSIIMCGLGGIYLEVLKDTAAELAPVSFMQAKKMIQSLKCYPLFKGVRNQPALNEDKFADIISRISLLMDKFPEVQEIDLNPVIATANQFRCVDARILIKTKKQQLQEI